jgi:hypothetical protein
LTWTDRRSGNYDIYTVWSEDGGMTLRSDQHRVNRASPSIDDQYWPTPSLFLPDSIRRLDVDWWDTRTDPNGDIYYNGAKWWRTDLDIVIHDSLANPMAGTVTLTYTSFGVVITRGVREGHYIVYHDEGTTISLSQMSSGSTSTERWIWSDTGPWSYTPRSPGTDTTIVYYNQYYTTFTAESGNPPACGAVIPTGIAHTFDYYAGILVRSTVHTHWANNRGNYSYTAIVPPSPTDTRWFCPTPTGRVTSPTVSPVYYYQYRHNLKNPEE